MAGSGKRRRLGVEMGVGSGLGWMPHLWIMAFPLDEQTDAAAPLMVAAAAAVGGKSLWFKVPYANAVVGILQKVRRGCVNTM